MVAHPCAAIDPTTAILSGASVYTDASRRATLDSRIGEFASMTTSATNQGAFFNVAGASFTMNRYVIPAGHNLAGVTLSCHQRDSGGFFATIQTDVVPLSTAAIDVSFPEETAQDGAGIIIQAIGTWIFGEIWFGERVALSTGANASAVQPGFRLEWEHAVRSDVIAGRDATVELAPPRRRFTLEARYVVPGTDDARILEDVLRLGRTAPFWYWPPDDADPGPYLVKLEDAGARRQESIAPQAQIAYEVRLEMVQQLS
jgi:hypothetical protein